MRPVSDPIKPRGGYSILYGDLAPDGCIVKLAGHGREKHTGPARVFDSEEAAFAAVQARKIVAGGEAFELLGTVSGLRLEVVEIGLEGHRAGLPITARTKDVRAAGLPVRAAPA